MDTLETHNLRIAKTVKIIKAYITWTSYPDESVAQADRDKKKSICS